MSERDFLIRQKLLKYHIDKNKQKYIGELSESDARQVLYIDHTLKCFNQMELDFIFNVYIFNQKPLDVNKSRSSYYYSKNKVKELLYKILVELK